jgi:hypothetical protein
MSDDDLWRSTEPPAAADPGDPDTDSQPGGANEPPAPPAPPVDDQTRPLTGVGPAAVPPPHNPYLDPQDPYANRGQAPTPPPTPPPTPGHASQPPPSGAPGYLPPPNPYPAPNEYAAPQSPYGAPYQPAYAGGQRPDHPSATTAMVLGIVGLVGLLFCAGLTLVLSPVAWVVGGKAVREIDAAPGQYAGRDRANAGKIMGIIGTVLLALGILAVIAFVVLAFAVGSSDNGTVVHHRHVVHVAS